MDYSKAIPAFVDIVNVSILEKIKEYAEQIEVHEDGYYTFDPETDKDIIINGMVISSTDWIDGDPESEYIKVPVPCTEDQYKEICHEILKRSLWYEKHLVSLEKARGHLEEYTAEFAAKIKTEWQIFANNPRDFIPVYITDSGAIHTDKKHDCDTGGYYSHSADMISIYFLDPDKIEKAEQTVRHEVLHMFLHDAGLPDWDDSFLFWFFAEVYDAHPYAELNETNQRALDAFRKVYGDNGKEAIDIFLTMWQKDRKDNKQDPDPGQIQNATKV